MMKSNPLFLITILFLSLLLKAQLSARNPNAAYLRQSWAKFKNCGLISKLISTDSYPNPQVFDDDFIEVRSLAVLIGEVL